MRDQKRKPLRIRLERRKGFNLLTQSLVVNGLEAVKVDRSTKWGNPFVVGADGGAAECVKRYREKIGSNVWSFPTVKDIQTELRGKNPACWCAHGTPCHADVLLEIANP
jgi:hypothetical protein